MESGETDKEEPDHPESESDDDEVDKQPGVQLTLSILPLLVSAPDLPTEQLGSPASPAQGKRSFIHHIFIHHIISTLHVLQVMASSVSVKKTTPSIA